MPKNGPKQFDMPWTTVPITPAIQSQVSLCYKSNRKLSKSAQLFVDFCTEYLFSK